jgi:hypothetical protein
MKAKDTSKRLRELIKICGVMDLYENNDDSRFQVIKQMIESKNKEIACLRNGIKQMNISAIWGTGKW